MSRNNSKHRQTRPSASQNIQVAPEFHKNPDIEKLGLAFISIAKGLAEKKAAQERIEGYADRENSI